MRRYSEADEQRIHLQTRVRAWTRSGLLGREQGQALEASLQGDLKRTGLMLRLGLALFTGIVLVAAVGLSFMLTDLRDEKAVAVMLAIFGVLSILAADRVVTAFTVYRHGVEEMLAMAGVGLLAFSPLPMTSGLFSSSGESIGFALAGATGCAASLWVYRRFGFLYAAIAAMACAANVPLQLGHDAVLQRVLTAAIWLAAFAVARAQRVEPHDDRRGAERARLQAAALVGAYLYLNLHPTPGLVFVFARDGAMVPWFYWGTYACIWLLPAAALWLGVRDRERWLIDAGLAMALATVVTNKSYWAGHGRGTRCCSACCWPLWRWECGAGSPTVLAANAPGLRRCRSSRAICSRSALLASRRSPCTRPLPRSRRRSPNHSAAGARAVAVPAARSDVTRAPKVV